MKQCSRCRSSHQSIRRSLVQGMRTVVRWPWLSTPHHMFLGTVSLKCNAIYNLHYFHNLYKQKKSFQKVTSCVSLKIHQKSTIGTNLALMQLWTKYHPWIHLEKQKTKCQQILNSIYIRQMGAPNKVICLKETGLHTNINFGIICDVRIRVAYGSVCQIFNNSFDN